MKKYILGIIVIILVVFVSGCISDSDDTNEPKTLSQNGILFKYPGDWIIANSLSNDSIAAIADPNSVNQGSSFAQVNVNIERKESSSMNTLYNQTYSSLLSNSDYELISEGNVTIGDISALECSYTQNENGTVKQHRAIWIQKDNNVYVILFTAPQSEFQNQNKNFEYILNNFKIT